MAGRITGFLREYIFGLSIIVIIVGIIVLFMGVLWYGFRDSNDKITIQLGPYTNIIETLGDGNAYFLVIGLIVFGTGVYYLYSYLKNRKFAIEELDTNKRSEFLKKHTELKDTVKRLPKKYKRLLKEKEKELRIK